MNKLTQQELKKLFKYDYEKGVLIKRSTNKVVGSYMKGYLRVCINYKNYLVHRLVWLYHYGKFPSCQLDHVNSNRQDNRIENLRESSFIENSINIPNRSNNLSGVVGVSLHRSSGKWQSRISYNKKNIALGIFSSFEEAVKIRYEAELKFNYHLLNNRSSAKNI